MIGSPGTEVSHYTQSWNCTPGGVPAFAPFSCGVNTIQVYQWPGDTDTGYAYVQFVNGQVWGGVTGYPPS
jgi:hypothetical protein